MLRASRRRWFLLACTSLLSGSAACGQAVDGPDDNANVGTVAQAAGAQQAFMNESSFAIYATNSISIGNEAHIHKGRVGVRRTGPGPSLIPGYEMAIGTGAVVSTTQDVHADSMFLQSGATLGAIHANDVVDLGANHGPMFPLGAMPALPILPQSFPGITSLNVPANTVLPVQTDGQYQNIVIGNHATLRLAGGLYQIQSLTLGTKSRIEAVAPTVLRIAGRLTTGEKSFIGPSVNAQQVLVNMRIEVDGTNGGVGGVTDYPRAVLFGEKSDVRAIVFANRGTMTFSEKVDAVGAFYGSDIEIKPKVDIEPIFREFPAPSPCRYEVCTYQNDPINGTTTICVRPPMPAGTSCADKNLCNGNEVCDGNGTCLAGTPVDDGNPCTTCSVNLGAIQHVSLPMGTPCDDGNVCNGIATCDGKFTCIRGIPLPPALIDDGDECTTDTCDPTLGPVHTSINVNDGNPNTVDWCDPLDGGAINTTCAPPDPTVPTQIVESMKCIIQGTPPLQTEINDRLQPGSSNPLDPATLAAVRGYVVGLDGAPISGVKVRVLDGAAPTSEPFGHTYTLANGGYSMVIGGGVARTIVFEKQGFLTIQRLVEAGLQQDLPLDNVIMRRVDLQATSVQVNAPFLQVARGSLQSDDDGTRRTTLMFAPNTTATMTIPQPNGSPLQQPLNAMTVRATEFTVGPNGPLTMPATLPEATGYTYAAELSIDEAIAAGATKVNFSHPVSFYLENFLNMPVGTAVPVGVYDRNRGQWVPENNGRVIQIVGKNASGAIIEPNQVDAILSPEERLKLAELYSVGATLWRVQLEHFSVVDLNWPIPPKDSCIPDDASCPLAGGPEGPNTEDDPCTQNGSIIECENQILGERVAIAGTPYTLNYRSDRAFGRKEAYTLSVPVTGPNDLPPVLKSIKILVDVAGRRIDQSLDCPGQCPKNERVDMTWDGLDANGNVLHGAQVARVSVGYEYDVEYGDAPPIAQSFGSVTYSFLGVPARTRVVRWKRWQTTIGAFSAESLGLGGFTLDRHHVYDPIGRVLYRGDGSRVSARVAPTMLDMAATNTNTTNIGLPKSLAVLPDGTIAFVDHRCTVRRIDKDRNVTILAGQANQCGFAGDGGPATQALLAPTKIATGPDGSLYVSEYQNNRIRRIRPNGIIETIAGNGLAPPGMLPTENTLATNTHLPSPGAIAVNKDGDVFVQSGLIIYRISPSGQLTRYAGGGGGGFPNNSNIVADPKSIGFLPAPSALATAPDGTLYIGHGDLSGHVYHVLADGRMLQIPTIIANPEALAVAADGTVYVTSITGMNRPQVKAIVADSDVSTVAGANAPPSCPGLCGVGGPALAADLKGVFALAAAPDGAVWVADGSLGHLLRIRPSMPFVSAGFYEIMNDAGTEIYRFEADGRHQSTKDARTGAIIESFAYDAHGRLSKVTDRDGLETRFEHDPQTLVPTQIVGHFNHVTTLGTDNEGYLNSVTNQAGEQISMTYYPTTGLLQQWVDAKSQPTSFAYDFTTGRLTKDSNAANGFKTLLKTPIAGGYRVDLTTRLGRKTSYDVQRSAGETKTRSVTAPSGIVVKTEVSPSGLRTTTFVDVPPAKTMLKTTLSGDPRFGLQAPIAALEEIETGGKKRTIERTREVTMNPNTPTELVEQIDRVKINDLPFETRFTAALGLEDTKTPLNRHILRYMDATGRVIKEQIGSLEPMEYFYDGEGLLQQIKWGNRIWDLGYGTNGHISSMVNPLLEMTQMGTDAVGRLTSETNPLSHVTSVGYDDNGNASSVTPAGKPLHGMTYTPLDQLETYTAPTVNGQPSQTNWTYDFDGDLDKVTLPDQSIVDHTRDNAGRPKTIILPGGEGTITLGYDSTTGHLTTLTGPQSVNLTLGYNGSLLTDQTFSDMTVSTTVHHDHDDFFRVVNETVNGLFPATFHYDADGLLDAVGGMTLGRNAQTGLLDGSTLGNVEDDYSRNAYGEVTNYVAKANGAVIFDVITPRDGMGRIDSRTEIIGGQTTFVDYVYDAAGRLTDANGAQGSVHYDYDSNGNRLGRTDINGTESGTYDAQDRLKTYAGRTYVYNVRGSLESVTNGSATTNYTYDALGGLRQVVLPNGTNIDYEVDGAGRRVWKSRNGLREQGFVYADGLRPVAELNGSGQIVARFIYGRHVNVPDIIIKNGRAYRIVTDHLGSPQFVVDTQTGAIAQTMTYDEYGRVTSDSAPGFQPFGFAGGMYDRDTQLVRFGARDYDAFTGRWTAKDPILWAGGQGNLYGYVGNDPVNLRDPQGLWVLQALGFGLGFASQAWVNYDAMRCGRIDVGTYLANMVWGGVVGAAATLPTSIIGGAFFGAAGAGIIEGVNVTSGAKRGSTDDLLKAVLLGGFFGGVGNALAGIGGNVFRVTNQVGPLQTYGTVGGSIGLVVGTFGSNYL